MRGNVGVVRRNVAVVLAIVGLVLAPLPFLAASPAQAATVPVTCSNSSSGLTVTVGEVVSFGGVPSGCTFLSNSSSGNLDRVSDFGFVAFAAGSGGMLQLMLDGDGVQVLNSVSVTILEAPSPTPTPTGTATSSPTASPSASGDSSATPTGTATATPTDPPYLAPADPPLKSQRLSPKDITPIAGSKPGEVIFLAENGNPLQLLGMSGATGGIAVVDKGLNYSTRPANWQRLGYGDTCWTYAGYADVQGFVLPVATPPFSTVPANWIFTSAILGTATGNTTYLNPKPGQVVDAGGRDIATLTLCSEGVPNALVDGSVSTRAKSLAPARDAPGNSRQWCHVPPGQGPNGPGRLVGGGGGHPHRYDYRPINGQCTRGLPVLNPVTSSTTPSTQQPAPEKTVPMCQATVDPVRPYIYVAAVPLSQLPSPAASGENLYPQPGWSSIIPKTNDYPGQNWTTAGQAIFEFNCNVSPATPTPQPSLTPTPAPTAVPTPAPILTPQPDPLQPVCRATKDPRNPYRLETVRTSRIVATGGDGLYPTAGWTDILPPAPNLASGQNWPAGASLLRDAAPACTMTVVVPVPQQPISGLSPGPQPTQAPDVTGFSPGIIVTPLPQPSFTGYGTITPWPPLQPVPMKGTGKDQDPTKYLTPSPYPTPPSPTPTPTLTPSPDPTPPSPTPSPTLTPPTPTVTVTPIAQPSFIDFGPVCAGGPCLIPPLQRPATPNSAVVKVPNTLDNGSTPTPTASATPTPSSAPTATPDTGAPVGGRVTFLLTNGPDTVTYTTTVDQLVTVAVPTSSTTTTTTPKPAKPSAVEAGRSRLNTLLSS